MSMKPKTLKESPALSNTQIQSIVESHAKLREVIDLANYTRRHNSDTKDIDYFQQFFMKAQKLV